MFLLIIAVYYVVLLVVAHLTSRGANASTFFNGNRNSPWYLVAFGAIGATVSGVTFVSVPGEVGTGQWHYLQFVLGNFLGYWLIALVLIPLYYRLGLISIYDYLRQRFGSASHRTGALFFILSQMMGASFRLFLVIGVLQILVFDGLGVPFELTATACMIMIWLYIRRAGIKTVVWTDTLQTLCILAAVVLTVCSIAGKLDLNFSSLMTAVASSEHSEIIDSNVLSRSYFWKQLLSGIGIVIVMNGLDQNIMQKNLTCRNEHDAKKNMFTFSFAFLLVNVLFLSLGTLLYIFADAIEMTLPARTDDLFPLIVSEHLPAYVGVVFLLGIIAASFSSADSSLTALTTVWCIDIMRLDPQDESTDKRRKRITVLMAVAMLATLLIFHAINDQSIVSAIFTVAGYTYGPLLGLFAFGLTTKRQTREKAVPAVCIAAPIICLILNYLTPILLGGYKLGFELLLINGALVFGGLWMTSTKQKK